MIEVLRTKLFMPQRRSNLVQRPRLVDQLNNGLDKKLTLISAPAGFGKTTLVVEWLNQIDVPGAWISLDEADNNLRRFLTYLATTLQQVDEEVGSSLLNALQSPQLLSVERLQTALLNEIALRTDPLILVLDDYHRLTDVAIMEAIEFLLFHPPPQLHLVITTREDPALPLARLRALNQLNEIRANDLRFTREEADIFFREVMGLSLNKQDLVTLEDRTEGWAAGLQLAGLSMQRQGDLKGFIDDFSGSHRHILDYLTDEVLQHQSENVRSFLLQTAILDRLTGPLCDALTGRNDGDEQLVQLETANLFVNPLDDERRWYRYHHLFADLLRSQLTRSQPQLIPELHRRASRWYVENGDIGTAIDHALKARDLTLAAQLIEKYALQMLYRGEVTLVLSWFDHLPDATLHTSPLLCISKAWALALMQRGNRQAEVEQTLGIAENALDDVSTSESLRNLVTGHAASIRVFVMQWSSLGGDNPQALVALSQKAQQLLPLEEKAIRSVNELKIGYGYLVLADLEAARRAYQHAQEDGLAGGNLYAAIYGPINLVLIEYLVGHLQEALDLCERSIEKFNKLRAGQNFSPIGALYTLRGIILLEYNQLAESEKALTEGLDLVRWTGESIAHRKGYIALARLRAIQGDQSAMLAAVKTLEETLPENTFYARALSHRLLLRHWPADVAVQKDASAWLAQFGNVFDGLTVIDSVDPNSRANFEGYLNATHVMARLATETPGTYSMEGAHVFLTHQQDYAASHGFVHWDVAISIARTLLYQAMGEDEKALNSLEQAVKAALHTGLLRIFADECDRLTTLLVELKRRSTHDSLISYAHRILEASRCTWAKPETQTVQDKLLSQREIEVLKNLASGLTYEEIGRHLYLSLNTVQFHVKNIYGKLQVNKRVEAVEKALEMKLI